MTQSSCREPWLRLSPGHDRSFRALSAQLFLRMPQIGEAGGPGWASLPNEEKQRLVAVHGLNRSTCFPFQIELQGDKMELTRERYLTAQEENKHLILKLEELER